ncbi:glycosyltransferase family 2 protein [Betaproteobacteria bacterium SCN2]|jgi:glycosyltransferase involved in cell wall biosynthesis|nr:glycosyltransferase family 2 protein [Betaproteobacteria bacterium SCN2]
MEKLSAFVTTFNNDRTLAACLESVKWADEIVVLDSFSTDGTERIAREYGCRFSQHKFMGYGPQKQMALEQTSNRWVLLLDADEVLSPESQAEIQALMQKGPDADGYTLPRQEQLFWKMSSPGVRMNHFLRLFDKTRGRVSDMPIHAAPEVRGEVKRLQHPFYHFGETSIHVKVDKINHYSTGLVADKQARGKRANPWIMVFYPPLFFLRSYLFKRSFLNGWAGFIGSVTMAYYVFLKYAKLYEAEQFAKHGDSLLPQASTKQPVKAGRQA